MSAKLTTDQDDVAINGDLTRYRALPKISGIVGAQPTVDAVLHSLAVLLSNVVAFDRVALLFPWTWRSERENRLQRGIAA
jgi:hypothetical protein